VAEQGGDLAFAACDLSDNKIADALFEVFDGRLPDA
jgi:hypothetical protein